MATISVTEGLDGYPNHVAVSITKDDGSTTYAGYGPATESSRAKATVFSTKAQGDIIQVGPGEIPPNTLYGSWADAETNYVKGHITAEFNIDNSDADAAVQAARSYVHKIHNTVHSGAQTALHSL